MGLNKVSNFFHRVEVLDEEPGDDEEGGGQRTYKLSMSCILPFPKRNDPSSTQEFIPGKHVLAVYPGTTALYKATVISTPRKVSCFSRTISDSFQQCIRNQ
jgi:SAGA-associated factor 29